MEDKILFAINDISRFQDDEDEELAIATVKFLSTRENSHKIKITEEILRRDAQTLLGKWLVAKMNEAGNDATTHKIDEVIVGNFPKDQEIKFEELDDGTIVASADAVISKIYATKFYDIFMSENQRNVSVEMLCYDKETDEFGCSTISGLKITGVTCLGISVKGSCPDANMSIIRFSEEEAEKFYQQKHQLDNLQKFAEERRKNTAKKYKVDKSKESISNDDWSEIDKTELRNKILEASNTTELVKSVYLLIEDGWKDAPSEKLKYPVMQFDGDKLVYNRNALSNALARAVQNNEDSVVKKVKSIYKKLDLDDTEKKEEKAEMSFIEKFALDIGNVWDTVYNAIRKHTEWYYGIEGIFEENGQKFVILRGNDAYYRVDFDWTEEDGLVLADEKVEVKKEYIATDSVTKFAEPEDVEKFKEIPTQEEEKEEEKEETEETSEEKMEEPDYKKMFEDEQAKCAEIQAKLDEQCDIVMKCNEELEELRKFKADIEEQKKIGIVNALLAKIKGKMSDEDYEKFAKSGSECKFEEVNIWRNTVMAAYGEAVVASFSEEKQEDNEIIKMELPKTNEKKSCWDRL